jgi:hypothetical protein
MAVLGRWGVLSATFVLATAISAPNARASLMVVDSAEYGGHTYLLLDVATWVDSEAAAVDLGGHLVHINDAAENDFVTTRFGTGILDFVHRGGLWIGLTDQVTEGTFVWADGTPLGTGYSNFASGEPNNCAPLPDHTCLSEDYVTIPWYYPPQWNDLPDFLADGTPVVNNGVVEIDTVVPEPSSLLLLSLGLSGIASRIRRRS